MPLNQPASPADDIPHPSDRELAKLKQRLWRLSALLRPTPQQAAEILGSTPAHTSRARFQRIRREHAILLERIERRAARLNEGLTICQWPDMERLLTAVPAVDAGRPDKPRKGNATPAQRALWKLHMARWHDEVGALCRAIRAADAAVAARIARRPAPGLRELRDWLWDAEDWLEFCVLKRKGIQEAFFTRPVDRLLHMLRTTGA